MKICKKCGQEKEKHLFRKSRKSCKQCDYVQVRAWHVAHKEQVRNNHRKNIRKIKTRFNAAKRQAEKRNKEWSLTQEEYELVVKEKCIYCKGYFKAVETGSGLDRIDNSQGYISGNVVSCCETCNKVKNEFLTFEETIRVMDFIIEMKSQK